MIRGSKISSEKEKDMNTLYQENITLKKQNQALQQRINNIVKGTDTSLTNFKKQTHTSLKQQEEVLTLKIQNQRLSQKIKALSDMKALMHNKQGSSKAIRQIINNQKKKSTDLLKIIQTLKNQLKAIQKQNIQLKQQIRQLKIVKHTQSSNLQQEQHYRMLKKQTQSMAFESQQRQADTKKGFREIQKQLYRQKDRTRALENALKNKQFQLLMKKEQDQQLIRIKRDNRQLENSLKKLTQKMLNKPDKSLQSVTNYEQKSIELQEQLNISKTQLKNAKQGFIKYKTQAQMYQNRMVKAQQQSRYSQSQLSQFKQKNRLNPILNQIINNNKLQKVLGFLANQGMLQGAPSQIRSMASKSDFTTSQQNRQLLRKVQMLTNQKAKLAAQLHRTTGMLQALKQSYQYKDKINQVQQKQTTTKLKEYQRKNQQLATLVGRKLDKQHRVYQTKGVRYADDVSVFSTDHSATLKQGQNYFDFYVGQINMIERVATQQSGIKNPKQIVTIATVDFYNYQTISTKPARGCKHDFKSEISFKVNQDPFLIQYMEKDIVQVDIWTSQHMKSVQLGTAKIPLKPLLLKSKTNIAPVLSSEASLYIKGIKICGTLAFRMRMRQPIDHLLKSQQDRIIHSAGQKRRLIINVRGAQGIPRTSNSFVFYCINGTDYNTGRMAGPSPAWDSWTSIQINYNQDFVRWLTNKQLEFTIIDDNIPVNSSVVSDVIGIAKAKLTALITQPSVQLNIPLISGQGAIKGQIYISIYWHQHMKPKQSELMVKKSTIAQDWQVKLKNKITISIKNSGDNIVKAFKRFDKDDSHTITQDQFRDVVIKQLKVKASKDQLAVLFYKIPKPVTLKAFDQFFGANVLKNYDIRQINQLLEQHTTQIKKSQNVNLQNFLAKQAQQKGSVLQLSLDMDLSADGLVSIGQLQAYLLQKGVTCQKQEITDLFKGKDHIKIADLIQTVTKSSKFK